MVYSLIFLAAFGHFKAASEYLEVASAALVYFVLSIKFWSFSFVVVVGGSGGGGGVWVGLFACLLDRLLACLFGAVFFHNTCTGRQCAQIRVQKELL